MENKNTNRTKYDNYHYLKIFIVFFFLFAFFTKMEVGSWNDSSRMAQIQSLVERSTLIIDKSTFTTGDKYFYNNHFYSDKPPILALYAAPSYFVLKNLGLSFEFNSRWSVYLVTLMSIGSLSALGLTVFKKILMVFFNASDQWSNIVTFITCTGTLILPYSIYFNNHLPSGVFALIGLYWLFNINGNGKLQNAIYSGFFFSLAGGIDINFFLFLPFILILFLRKSLKAGVFFGLSCIPIITIYLYLNYITSGSLIPPAMNWQLWEYPGSAFSQENLSGLANHKNILSVLIYAFHMLIGNRGIISHSPILIYSLFSLLIIYKQNKKFPHKVEFGFILLVCLLYIGIYIFKTTNYSGWSFGVRWFVSLMLILCIPITYIDRQIALSKIAKLLFVSITCLSIFISIIGTYSPFSILNGTEAEELLSPTNTVISNIIRIVTDFSINTSSAKEFILSVFPFIRLLLGACIIYFLLYQYMKKMFDQTENKAH